MYKPYRFLKFKQNANFLYKFFKYSNLQKIKQKLVEMYILI